MPVCRSVEELASHLHIDKATLNGLIWNNSRHYKKFNVPKKSGGDRLISQPSKPTKAVQAWVLRNILDKLTVSPHATAFVRGRSIRNNAEPHKTNRYFLLLDLEDFFGSIVFSRVYHLFHTLGYSRKLAWVFSRLCTCDDSLPQGGVTSPALSNLIALKLDRRLSGFCARRNIVYSRYADDLCFSARNPRILASSLSSIKMIIESERFVLNDKKQRFLGPKQGVHVTGLTKNSAEARFSVSRDTKRIIRASIHRLSLGRSGLRGFNSLRSIDGWISFLRSVDSSSAEKFMGYRNRKFPSETPLD